MQRAQLGAGSKPKVVREALDELLIRLAGARALAAARQPRHVCAQRGFVERVGVEQARRQIDCFRRIDVRRQTAERRVTPGKSQAIALKAQPARPRFTLIVVKSGEKLAAMHRQRIGDALLAQRRVESEYIGLGIEPKRTPLRLDPACPAQRLQPMQRLAQVGVGELVFLLGPEQ